MGKIEVEWINFIILGIFAALVLYAIVLYNNLTTLKHNVDKTWSNIDALLKQRHDELPELVETCKQYMQHEQKTLEQIMQARARVSAARERADVGALGPAETGLRLGLGNLFALAENYPDLKANDTFRHLQGRITALENAIADRREFYNAGVNQYNVRTGQFPDVIIARMFSFPPRPLLVFSDEESRLMDMNALSS